MFSKWITESGVSLGTKINCPRSLRTTSAARSIKLSDNPMETAANVPMEHGQITILRRPPEPDANPEYQSKRP